MQESQVCCKKSHSSNPRGSLSRTLKESYLDAQGYNWGFSIVPKTRNYEYRPSFLPGAVAEDWDITEYMRDLKIKYLTIFSDPCCGFLTSAYTQSCSSPCRLKHKHVFSSWLCFVRFINYRLPMIGLGRCFLKTLSHAQLINPAGSSCSLFGTGFEAHAELCAKTASLQFCDCSTDVPQGSRR